MLRTYRRAARDVDECWVRTAGFLQQFKRNPQEIRTRSSATFAVISQFLLIQHARREKCAAGLQQLASVIQRVQNRPLEGPKSVKNRPLSAAGVQEHPRCLSDVFQRCLKNHKFGHESGPRGFPWHDTLSQRSATPLRSFLSTSQSPETPLATSKYKKNIRKS